MKAHELARGLLCGPDIEVYIPGDGYDIEITGLKPPHKERIELCTLGDSYCPNRTVQSHCLECGIGCYTAHLVRREPGETVTDGRGVGDVLTWVKETEGLETWRAERPAPDKWHEHSKRLRRWNIWATDWIYVREGQPLPTDPNLLGFWRGGPQHRIDLAEKDADASP